HDAHASDLPNLLGEKAADSCFNCHESLVTEFKHTHKPFAQKQCLSCHNPHQADNGQLLRADSVKLCVTCHQKTSLQKDHRNFPSQPKECLSCHNPHGSDQKHLIRNFLHKPYADDCKTCHEKEGGTSAAACLNCHEGVKKKLYSTHSHLMAAGNKNSCTQCHSPHAGNNKNLLKKEQTLLCRGCHEETMRRKENSTYSHPETALCSNCHEVHGSNTLAMLKGNGNDVCTGCHKGQGQFTHPVGEKIIDPRTGQMVTCVSCHYPMGTDYKFQLKRSGQKQLCILCHRTY
ncbi:MAG: hypothetical protein OEL66_03990, partial [Desulfobulbaceae bacterium]|nr:hypothetical protein [Desulfobulbaceae bacterium]